MISEMQVQLAAMKLLKRAPAWFPTDRIAQRLNEAANTYGIQLSAGGYIEFLFEQIGSKILWRNMASSPRNIEMFVKESCDIRDTLPELLVNAGHYFEKVLSNIPDLEAAIACVENMTFPYVLYLLYKSSGKDELAARYEEAAREKAFRFPAMFDKLPPNLKALGKELCEDEHCADTR